MATRSAGDIAASAALAQAFADAPPMHVPTITCDVCGHQRTGELHFAVVLCDQYGDPVGINLDVCDRTTCLRGVSTVMRARRARTDD